MEYFAELGYLGLFLSSFLAATVLPLSSEVVLFLLLSSGLNPLPLITVATLGNVLGSLTNYAIGYWGGIYFIIKVLKVSEVELLKAQNRVQKYGVVSLLFAWVPVVGDPLTVAAGILRINLLLFLLLVTMGKMLRYVAISYAVLQ